MNGDSSKIVDINQFYFDKYSSIMDKRIERFIDKMAKKKYEAINSLEFLSKYFKDKPDFNVLDSIFDQDQTWIGQQAGDDYLNIDIFEEDNIFYCKITTCELNAPMIAKFIMPSTYKEFKQLMDVFTKDNTYTLG